MKKELKRALLTGAVMLSMLGANASAEDTYMDIVPARMASENMYMISVGALIEDDNIRDDLHDCNYVVDEMYVPYECRLRVNGETIDLGEGRVNSCYDMEPYVYWEVPIKFDGQRGYDIVAKIYDDEGLIDKDETWLNVHKAYGKSEELYTTRHNFTYEYQLIACINEYREKNGLKKLKYKDWDSLSFADDRLSAAVCSNNFSHSFLKDAYKDYEIDCSKCEEFFAKGQFSPEDVYNQLITNEAFVNAINKNYNRISVSAQTDNQDVMYWAIELYK